MPVFNQGKMVAGVSSGHQAISTGPTDICKTPTPAGPIPLPYPNISATAIPGSGYATKTFAGGAPLMNRKSKTALSNGDEAGAAGGVSSGKIMGMAEMLMASTDVMAEGAGMARTADNTMGNG